MSAQSRTTMLFPTWSIPMDHMCFSHATLVGGTSKAGHKATQKKGRWEILGCCSTFCPCNMGDALHRACGLLWWPAWPWGKGPRESQPLLEHQELLPGFGRSLRTVYEKEPVKLNVMMAIPSLTYHACEARSHASLLLMLGYNHVAVPGPHRPDTPCFLLGGREGKEESPEKTPSISASLLHSIMSLQDELKSGPIDFYLIHLVFLQEGTLRHYDW